MRVTAGFLLGLLAGLAAANSAGTQTWQAPAEARALRNPVRVSPRSAAEGRKLYRNYCLACHGEQGRGDGPWVSRLPDSPGNLADPVIKEMTDGELFWKISEGRNLMPGYARTLRPQQRWHLVNYLRTLTRSATGQESTSRQ